MDDRDAELLRNRIGRAVRSACPGWLADEVDDLAQRATMKLLRTLDRAPGQPLQASYIWRAAHSEVIDEIRRRRLRRESCAESGDPDSLPESERPSPEREAQSRQLGEAIAECLRRLVRARRRAVVLHLQGHALQEIAALFGWSGKRADNLVYRGLRDLRQCLAGKGYQR